MTGSKSPWEASTDIQVGSNMDSDNVTTSTLDMPENIGHRLGHACPPISAGSQHKNCGTNDFIIPVEYHFVKCSNLLR